MTEGLHLSRVGSLAVLRIDNPPVNALSPHIRIGLNEEIARLGADPEVTGIVLTGTGASFIAGADLKRIHEPRSGPSTQDLLHRMDRLQKPLVAAIQGAALGGGLEIAMACHGRVARAGVGLGLPEVTLGLLPGAGGTQRLPRLVGVVEALERITSGRAFTTAEALAAGLVDEVSEGDPLPAALAMAARLAGNLKRVRDREVGPQADFEARAAALEAAGPAAVREAVAALRDSLVLDFDRACQLEAQRFARLRDSAEGRARIHAFLAERASTKVAGISRDTPRLHVARVAIIGAGTMGGGIAVTFANAGYEVRLCETQPEALTRAEARLNALYEDQVRRGRMTEAAAAAARARLTLHGDLATAVAEADLVVEAVFEDMALKQQLFQDLDRLAPPHAILASNTSYQDIDALAAVTARPGQVVGMHYFSPANVMKLLEVVRGRETRPEVLATVLDLARRTGKLPVVSGVCYGFIGNRMLWQRTLQTQKLLLEGNSPRQIDRVLTDFGFRMGPCEMADLAGLDVGWRVRQSRGERLEPVDSLAEAGRWGQKTGKGFYAYPAGSRQGEEDPEAAAMIAAIAAAQAIAPNRVEPTELEERLLYPLINEGCRVLEEGIAARASDIDVVFLHGYGWPRATGGPMRLADERGLARIVARLEAMAEASGEEALRPAPLLRDLAQRGEALSAWEGKAQ